MTSDELQALLRVELPRRVPGLAAAYLFGSTARGAAGPGSDIDIGLLYETAPAPALSAQPLLAKAELESLLGRYVDLVVLNTAPVDLVHRVLSEGLLLLQPKPSSRIAFEVRARNEYFDLLPFLRRYRLGCPVVQTGSFSAWIRAIRRIAAGLALVLATLLSGAPELASLLLECDDCCESECEGSFSDKGCAPNCTQGSCAKSIVMLTDGVRYELRAVVSGEVRFTVPEPDLSPVPSGVFHPPRV